jgi:glutamate N-acetyltransferase/amino-acid N-acetyltransferase
MMKVDPKRGVEGFLFSAVSCGMKRDEGSLDLALIYSPGGASVAGAFTKNLVVAAPVVLDRERLKSGQCKAILANAGCANACTGPEGYRDALLTCEWIAKELGIQPEEVMLASTGVIGTRLPLDKMRKGIPKLVRGLDTSRLEDVARAIMTTDTRPKVTCREISLGKVNVRIASVAKGAGMIHPRMATMLCFVVTDAAISPSLLQECLNRCLPTSFNSITVDGDTSTNDTVLVLANGARPDAFIGPGSREEQLFVSGMGEVLEEMALEIVRDAEGATKLVHVRVEGAEDEDSAQKAARAIAHSPLVKTAFYGEDVNWGRIVAAAGYSGASMKVEELDLWYDDIQVLKKGSPLGPVAEEKAKEVARKREFTVTINLGMGSSRATIHTCDLSPSYVQINGSYRS